MKNESETELLRRIDSKLSALIVISLEDLLRRNPEMAKPRPRTVDRMLADAGLPPKEIASILGKSEQAVYLQLSKDAKKTTKQSVSPVPERPPEE